ncbi:uncharacterized protein STEHIDRAFT_166704 [Stereum hirsutum FP-91666 SS1]|uniref:uncharacterized protein n=1 Tax=Stereum hirsutum (strain FP-91666) TaxID=721885 RepID=UPI000440EA8F|nr:uncharacterized protein STEHIDRAFT_166704 [Stereum hirsutum FP-91666 SS1]EIM88669.1 hypothetical protein STEHIDRAFT_166704 [Stereum hirsutum FP-91666 SS1]
MNYDFAKFTASQVTGRELGVEIVQYAECGGLRPRNGEAQWTDGVLEGTTEATQHGLDASAFAPPLAAFVFCFIEGRQALLGPVLSTEQDDALFGELSEREIAWRDRQLFLQSRGYMLRPRLRPDWRPSWISPRKSILESEDAVPLPFRNHLVDATRLRDGEMVYIKRVTTDDSEVRIATYLSQDLFRQDPHNHSVPILDLFQDSENPDILYMVMPFLSLADQPPFNTVGEVVDFCDQVLEGLVFMHDHGVAHRDCAMKNLMFDSSAIFPQGHHPIFESFLPDFVTVAPRLSRTAAGGVKYYFVDFGMSSYFPPDAPRLALGDEVRDQEVPELSETIPYDPFKVDIFALGNVFRRELYDLFSNLSFLKPLIDPMLSPDHAARPTVTQAWEKWIAVRGGISMAHKSWRVRKRKEMVAETVVLDVVALGRVGWGVGSGEVGCGVVISKPREPFVKGSS